MAFSITKRSFKFFVEAFYKEASRGFVPDASREKDGVEIELAYSADGQSTNDTKEFIKALAVHDPRFAALVEKREAASTELVAYVNERMR